MTDVGQSALKKANYRGFGRCGVMYEDEEFREAREYCDALGEYREHEEGIRGWERGRR